MIIYKCEKIARLLQPGGGGDGTQVTGKVSAVGAGGHQIKPYYWI